MGHDPWEHSLQKRPQTPPNRWSARQPGSLPRPGARAAQAHNALQALYSWLDSRPQTPAAGKEEPKQAKHEATWNRFEVLRHRNGIKAIFKPVQNACKRDACDRAQDAEQRIQRNVRDMEDLIGGQRKRRDIAKGKTSDHGSGH